MALATIGAFVIHQYSEGVAVMLFYQIGELFQERPSADPENRSARYWTSVLSTPM